MVFKNLHKITIIGLFFITLFIPSVYALSHCPRCSYTIGSNDTYCKKCLLNLKYEASQEKAVKSVLTVRDGYDTFIRHPHTNNRAYKADRNAGGDKTGEIGVWGGPCNLRYLIYFDIESIMINEEIDFNFFTPQKALLYISALPKKSNLEVPVVVYPLTKRFSPGFEVFRERSRSVQGCTWYNATSAMPWQYEGGDYELKCSSRGVIKSGTRNVIDVTEVIKYFYDRSKEYKEWFAPGFIIMSDSTDISLSSGFVTIYSLNADEPSHRPELYIQ